MVYRYSWLAGFLAIGFALFQLNNLLKDTTTGPPWQLVVLAGLILGVIVTWTALSYRVGTILTVVINLVTALIAVVRVAAPETTALFFPTSASFQELRLQLDQALELIRNGVEPVIPVSGLVVIVTLTMWLIGGLLVWGLMKGHPYVGLLPPLVLSLQFATMDRNPSGPLLITVFLVLVTATMMAINADERDRGAGRMARPGTWPSTRMGRIAPSAAALLGFTILASVLAVGGLASAVPSDGVVDWRASTGLTGEYFGSISYNPFVRIRQQLLSQSNADVFVARIEGDVPADQVYFRLLTMETYKGGQFFADRPEVTSLDDQPWESASHQFAGPLAAVSASIQITRLRMDWLPAAYTPVAVEADRTIADSLRVRRDDGSLRLDGGQSFEGMAYQVQSLVPQPDYNVLASMPDGTLSPVFAAAAEDEPAGRIPTPVVPVDIREEPPNVDRYLELPEDLDGGIGSLARRVTANLATPFERGLALEAYFHDTSTFTYDAAIPEGHGATDLADWLLDPESPNFHTGYCEQFAASMAVMARELDIPSRVVLGFTPGDRLDDGRIVVRDRNAHAWVELWMPSQGWVQFDPTPRSDNANPTTYESLDQQVGFDIRPFLDLPDPVRPDDPGSLPRPGLPDDGTTPTFPLPGPGESEGNGTGFSLPGWVTGLAPFLIGLVVLLGLVPALKWWRRRRRMRRLENGDITAAWEEIITRLTDLGERPDPSLTPTELAEDVDEAMRPLAVTYTRAVYGPPGGIGDAHLRAATESLENTTARLATRYSTGQRMLAWYRPTTLIPKALMRSRNGRGEE